jgi:hypothetical protein
MSALLRDGTELTPAELREQAVGQGRLADYAKASGRPDIALKHIRRARELALAALQLEQSGAL